MIEDIKRVQDKSLQILNVALEKIEIELKKEGKIYDISKIAKVYKDMTDIIGAQQPANTDLHIILPDGSEFDEYCS